MKKIVVLLLVTVLIMMFIAPVFARVVDCPIGNCTGTYKSTKYTEWNFEFGDRVIVAGNPAREIYQYRYKIVKCSEKTHKIKEREFYGYINCF
jgi:hypothetical protein